MDHHNMYMAQALDLARQGLGRVWPNPSVGCVIVKDGKVVGAARTGDGGRPHAEEAALAQAGEEAAGAAVYVTLEPCAHARSEGLNCSALLVRNRVKEVHIACIDPNPKTNGKGVEALKTVGITVHAGQGEAEAREINRGFFLRVLEGRPFVTLKTATSADGKIAGGTQRWITGEEARRQAHVLRSRHDAILVGVGTVLADDPLLTTRLQDVEHRIIRVVMDTNLRLPSGSRLVQSAQYLPLWVFYQEDRTGRAASLQHAGCRLFQVERRSPAAVARVLAEEGITRVLVEGGAHIHTSFLEAGLYDEIAWFRAPVTIGSEGITAFRNCDILKIRQELPVTLKTAERFGEDMLEIYTKTS